MLVANAMLIEYSVEEQQAIQQAPTYSGEAYALYLAALDFFHEGTRDGVSRSIDALSEALMVDTSYVDAWSLMAEAHRLSRAYSENNEEREFH